MQIQKRQFKINERLIKVLRKIDEVLKRNEIYNLQEKINKILKFFISLQREIQCSVSNFSDIKVDPIYNSSPSKSKFFGKFFSLKFTKILSSLKTFAIDLIN